jgi:hypothetical protein
MSRGPGRLQLSILRELAQEPTGYLPWRSLRERFPHEVRDKSFYRAIRSLRRMGRIDDYIVDRGPGPGLCGRARYIAILRVYEVGGRLRFTLEADRELVALADAAQRQVKTLATARGILHESSRMQRSKSTSVDTYRRDRTYVTKRLRG